MNYEEYFFASCGELAPLCLWMERSAADADNFESAAVWRDRCQLFSGLYEAALVGEPVELEADHIDTAAWTLLVLATIPGSGVRVEVIDRRKREVAMLFGEDGRLDFHLTSETFNDGVRQGAITL